jgi:dihydroorotase
MAEAKRLGIPVSCHCDLGGIEAEAVRRCIKLGKKTGCHIHIAHISTKETVKVIRETQNYLSDLMKNNSAGDNAFYLSCEAAPHHIGAAKDDALRMGIETCGRVNPPLASQADRQALIAALCDGTIDCIATDHAPHSGKDKAAGAPGFSGLETAFAAAVSMLQTDIKHLSALMSARPAQILGLRDRGRIAEGLRADLVIADTRASWHVDPGKFKSRGKCSPFAGRELRGKILMTLNEGRIVYTC